MSIQQKQTYSYKSRQLIKNDMFLFTWSLFFCDITVFFIFVGILVWEQLFNDCLDEYNNNSNGFCDPRGLSVERPFERCLSLEIEINSVSTWTSLRLDLLFDCQDFKINNGVWRSGIFQLKYQKKKEEKLLKGKKKKISIRKEEFTSHIQQAGPKQQPT